ncbi:hypothetical protein PLICRDRAFT_401510 [Plicaturopsis crispa FD-325 SS-3]|nr:hypothetical protein PLICRDRAFT_401510 [Plicaturopsis crispa FD-325 SS-3]
MCGPRFIRTSSHLRGTTGAQDMVDGEENTSIDFGDSFCESRELNKDDCELVWRRLRGGNLRSLPLCLLPSRRSGLATGIVMSFPSQLEGAPPSKKRKTTTTPDRQAIPGQASGLVGAAGSTQQISVAQAPQTRPVSGPTPPNITNTPPLRWPPPSHQNTTFQPISTSTPAQHASGSNDAPPATSQSTIPANANVPPASTDTQSSATRRANLPPWEELVKSTRQLVHAMHDEGERKDEEIARLKDDLQASLDSKTIMERSHDLTIQQFNAKIKALEGDKLDLQTTARGSQALRMKLLTELGTTNEGLRTVRKELQEKSDVCDRLASRLNAANEQIRLGELERTRVSEELDTVRTTLRDRDTEVTELRKELAELHVVQSTLRDRDSKITTLENELEKLRVSESNLRGRDSEVERLKTELAELSASQASLRARDSEVSALKNELAQLRARPPAAVIQKTADIDMAQPPSSTPKRSIPGPIEHVFESWGVAKVRSV